MAGIGGTLALAWVAKRALTAFVQRMHEPDPDLCRGFASKGLHCLNLGTTTVYLLKGRDGYLMVDTGYAQDYDAFREGLARLGIALDEIKTLLLTHGHDDHAGFAARVLAATGARVIAHRDAAPALRRGRMTPKGIRFLNARVFVLATLNMLVVQRGFNYPPVPLDAGAILLDGDDDDVLRRLGFDARVMTTPGHTPGSISVVTDRGDVLCGDAVMSFLPITGARLRPIFLSDREAVFASWRKMLDRGATTIYPAHGPPVPAARLRDALERFRG
jgi:glyoxylase-like metal-dependent hydrolase (beta-lactamase superfamily II)